jgi:hypothetical protein
MQSLLIRERILGLKHLDTTKYIRYRGAVYGDSGNFLRCMQLWLYALDIHQTHLEPYHPMIQSSLVSFIDLFRFMMIENSDTTIEIDDMEATRQLQTDSIVKLLKKIIVELLRRRPTESSEEATRIINEENYDRFLVVIVHFLIVVADFMRHCYYSSTNNSSSSKAEQEKMTFKIKQLVYELIKLNPTTNSRRSTLLHLASSCDSLMIIKNHQTLSASFPSTELIKMLLECGADANALDGEKNSPLHLIMTAANCRNENNGDDCDEDENHQHHLIRSPSPTQIYKDLLVARLLLNSGCHLDTCNANKKTAIDLNNERGDGGGDLNRLINPLKYLSLKCLAAKVVRKHHQNATIDYRTLLPESLVNFVDLH